jgi:hypothetical protein
MSEIKGLLEQIEKSYGAAQRALLSPTIMAPQEFIQVRMDEIILACKRVAEIVGDEFVATDIVVKHLAMLEERNNTAILHREDGFSDEGVHRAPLNESPPLARY